jgi:hypothetical protein
VRISLSTVTAAILIIILNSSCRNRETKSFSQGEIHYSISYGGPSGSIPVELMPRTLVVSFKRDRILFDIQSPFGNMGIANLSNHEEEIYDTYVNMFGGGRFLYSGDPEETPPGMKSMNGMKITRTGKTAEILGFSCEHATVTLPSMPDSVFEIWFTGELDINDPNAANPFREIDGVLLKFFFLMGEREFIFEADGIYLKEIPDRIFLRREKYRRVTKEAMDEFIVRLVNF